MQITARKVLTYLVIVGIAMVAALNYELFIFPNNFAPAGLNGLCTMIQFMTGISVGYLSLLINIPLAIMVFFCVSKPLAIRSMVYVATFSFSLLVLDKLPLEPFVYVTDNGTSTILGPMVAGLIFGACYSVLLRVCAYSGGTDFVASVIHKHHPEKNFIYVSFTLNALVALLSYFVYGYKIEPVILCILYCYLSSSVSDHLLRSGRSAIRFEIITDYPKELSNAIIHRLHHSATLIPAVGMYHGQEKNLLICVVNKTQISALTTILQEYPNTFAVMSSVNEVVGNFKHLTPSGKPEQELLDGGDVRSV